MPKEKPAKDHLGNEYNSVKELCAAYGVYPETYRRRLKHGATLDQALAPDSAPTDPCRDHERRVFRSPKAMREHYGISKTAFNSRRKKGWTLEKTLTTPCQNHVEKDHDGRIYKNRKTMCGAYGVTVYMFNKRRALGWTLKEALTGELEPGHVDESAVLDHEGTPFATKAEMCAHWNVNLQVYARRRKSGMDMEQALTEPMAPGIRPEPCEDHEGREFPSMKAMCAHYGIGYDVYKNRIENGFDKKSALTTPASACESSCSDWSGREYPSITAMAAGLHIKRDWLKHWRAKGPDTAIRAAELACASHWPGTDAGRYYIRECVLFPWFLCESRGGDTETPHVNEVVLHADQILSLKDAAGMAP